MEIRNREALHLYQKLCERGIDKVVLSLVNPNFFDLLEQNDTLNVLELPCCVTPKYLQFVSQILEPKHFYQVIEERNIAHLCGNPTCSQKLDKELLIQAEEEKKKRGRYHIDLKNKRVYERSENDYFFCSTKCKKDATIYAENCQTTAPYTRDCL